MMTTEVQSSVESTLWQPSFNFGLIFILFVSWYIFLRILERNGTLDKWNASRALGFVLMVRTHRGQKALEIMAKPRKFWRAYGEVSVWICSVSLVAVALLVILAFISSLLAPQTAEPPAASELIAIPGLNPVIPLGWGIIAFVVSLIIHELGHGLQARAHGMRVRSFGLLQLGPLPLGAFAEPQYEELSQAPRRERLRMFAAGPATNIFAAVFFLVLLGLISTQFTAANEHVHIQGLVVDESADVAGMEPWDIIISVNETEVVDLEQFHEVIDQYRANDTILIHVEHADGTHDNLTLILGDKYEHYKNLGWSEDNLELLGIEKQDPFLGVVGLADATQGVDRLAGPLSKEWKGGFFSRLISIPFHFINLLIVPFEMQGVAIHPFEESRLAAGDGILASILGLGGLLFFVHLFFWLIWVNILLGFTNLIPIVPFDGGHMFRDFAHGWLDRFKRLRQKLRLGDTHPLWVEHIAQKATSYSSLFLFVILIVTILIPYF
jgi:membrane-associated protease RseP (regulator of RpoE activity)